MLVGGIAYQLVSKRAGAPDHVEALGQRVEIGAVVSVQALGVLGFGELGPQVLTVSLMDRFGGVVRVHVSLANWLLPRESPATAAEWRATHLHYVGDYELDHLCPALFGATVHLPGIAWPVTVTLEPNPLAHVMALTLLCEEGGHA